MVRKWSFIKRIGILRFCVWKICLKWIRCGGCIGRCVGEGSYGEKDGGIEVEMVEFERKSWWMLK